MTMTIAVEAAMLRGETDIVRTATDRGTTIAIAAGPKITTVAIEEARHAVVQEEALFGMNVKTSQEEVQEWKKIGPSRRLLM